MRGWMRPDIPYLVDTVHFFLGASSILSELFFETRLDPPPTYTLGTKEANERHHEGSNKT